MPRRPLLAPSVTPVAAASTAAASAVVATRPHVPRMRGTCGAARRALGALVSGTLVACAGRYQPYRPAPLDLDATPTAAVAAYQARRLDDPSVIAFLRAAGAAPTDSGWSPRQLALAAVARRPDVAVARAELAAARAAERTAGMRPEPSVSGAVERASRADEGKSSPWTISLTTGLTYETGGKRAARVARARAATLAARLRLDATGWETAQEAATTATALVAATHEAREADAESVARQGVLVLLRARYAEGRVSLADIAQAEADVRSAALDAVQARQAVSEAASALARALALPVSTVDTLPLRPDPVGACGAPAPAGESGLADSLRAVALRHRFDLGAALADYAAAEADVRTEIARQYPDVTVGPGLAWDEGVLRWVLDVGIPAIPRVRNRGPIAEALARRAARAARVHVVQDTVLSAVDAALADCRMTG